MLKAVADASRPRGIGSQVSRVVVSSSDAKNGLLDIVKAAVRRLGGRAYKFDTNGDNLAPYDVVITADGRRTMKVLHALAAGDCLPLSLTWHLTQVPRGRVLDCHPRLGHGIAGARRMAGLGQI